MLRISLWSTLVLETVSHVSKTCITQVINQRKTQTWVRELHTDATTHLPLLKAHMNTNPTPWSMLQTTILHWDKHVKVGKFINFERLLQIIVTTKQNSIQEMEMMPTRTPILLSKVAFLITRVYTGNPISWIQDKMWQVFKLQPEITRTGSKLNSLRSTLVYTGRAR